jgi:hypothetical protein
VIETIESDKPNLAKQYFVDRAISGGRVYSGEDRQAVACGSCERTGAVNAASKGDIALKTLRKVVAWQ